MVAFVILHYKNIVDTIDCIESIIKTQINKDYHIVVVDNGSNNKNDIERIKNYTEDLIILDENHGFAKGNNCGCAYSIKKYNPDFLIVINNDTLINDKKFIDRIYESYKKNNFDVIGPKILTNNGDSVNPFPVYKNKTEITKAIKMSETLIKIYQSKVLRICLKNYLNLKRRLKKPVNLKNGEYLLSDVALHGCALIFSKRYYERYSNVFYNETFLYHEEEFLYYRMIKDNLKFIYDPTLEIFHKEGSSLNNNFDNKYYEKEIFRNKFIIDSLQKLLNIMNHDKN